MPQLGKCVTIWRKQNISVVNLEWGRDTDILWVWRVRWVVDLVWLSTTCWGLYIISQVYSESVRGNKEVGGVSQYIPYFFFLVKHFIVIKCLNHKCIFALELFRGTETVGDDR